MQNHRIKTKHTSNLISPNSYKSKKKKGRWWKIFFKTILILFLLWCATWYILFRKYILRDLPDVSQVRDISFSQATLITDRNGKELYRLFSENREYVDYSWISQNMVNAIVAVEDQRYWEHAGLDTRGIVRAVINKLLHRHGRTQWASTIPQQLVKNLLLTNERTVVRKLKEITLTKQLDWVLDDMVKDTRWRLHGDELKRAKKEITLELYLNKVEFWNNAFGIEAAAQTYFAKPASELNVLESSILASIPKSASKYNPYTHRANTIWNLTIVDSEWNEYSFANSGIQSELKNKLVEVMWKADFSSKKDLDAFSKYLAWLINFSINVDGKKYDVSYAAWRKDVVLYRMFEDKYITQEELKQALLEWFTIELRKAWFEIKAPHFVMRVVSELEKKYDPETLRNWWLTIKTTLDLDIQEIAESSLKNNKSKLEVYGATNEAMLYLDSTNWDILAYVWSFDYFNEDIKWQNDMVQSARQVWSSIKPLIYALWFMRLPLTIDTPIYDIPFKIWPDRPNNSDGRWLWILPLRNALAYSRNIPAVKMITALGWQDAALPFLRSLWITSLSLTGDYWYTLALGAGEIPMMELASAYMHLSTPEPWVIDPILEIRSKDGSLIYQKWNKKQEQIIPSGVWYVMWTILSEPANMPEWWRAAYTVKGLKLWIKTGTSNMKTPKWDRARDGWLASYTPSRVAIFWWGNADGSAMYSNAYGWFLNAEAMRDFWSTLLANNYVVNEWMTEVEVGRATISKISWKLATESTPAEFQVTSIWYINTLPAEADGWAIPVEFDASCGGLSSPYTPASDLRQWYVITPSSFMPEWNDLKEIADWWRWSSNSQLLGESGFSWKVTTNYNNILLEMPQEYCEWRSPQISEDIHISIKNLKDGQKISNKPMVWFNVQAPNNVKRVTVSINDRVIWSTDYNWKSSDVTDVISSNLWDVSGNSELTLVAVDKQWYSNKVTIKVSVVWADTQPPFVLKDNTYVAQDGNRYRVVIFLNDDLSSVEWWTVSQDWKVLKNFTKNYAELYMTNPGVVSITAKDSFWNELKDTLDIRQYIPWYEINNVEEWSNEEWTSNNEEWEVVENNE